MTLSRLSVFGQFIQTRWQESNIFWRLWNIRFPKSSPTHYTLSHILCIIKLSNFGLNFRYCRPGLVTRLLIAKAYSSQRNLLFLTSCIWMNVGSRFNFSFEVALQLIHKSKNERYKTLDNLSANTRKAKTLEVSQIIEWVFNVGTIQTILRLGKKCLCNRADIERILK